MQNAGPDGHLQRTSRLPNTIPGLSHFRQGAVLSQHRIEAIMLKSIEETPAVEFQRRVVPEQLELSANSSYPITVTLRPLPKGENTPASTVSLPSRVVPSPVTPLSPTSSSVHSNNYTKQRETRVKDPTHWNLHSWLMTDPLILLRNVRPELAFTSRNQVISTISHQMIRLESLKRSI